MRRELGERRELLLRMKLLGPDEKVAFRFQIVGVGDAAVHGADRGWLMAWLGHSGSHAPQLMHSSVMMVATQLSVPRPCNTRGGATPHPIQTVLTLVNSRMPSWESSRP